MQVMLTPALPALPALMHSHLGEELSGTIPAEGWQALEALVTLNLSGTGVSGPLAAAFPDGLQDLLLDGNALTSISPAWRPPPHLHTLLLVRNQLNQTVGQQQGWLAEAGELRALNLAYNSLRGSLPADLELPPSLTALGLFHNRLTGEMPASSCFWACWMFWHAEPNPGGRQATVNPRYAAMSACLCRHAATRPSARHPSVTGHVECEAHDQRCLFEPARPCAITRLFHAAAGAPCSWRCRATEGPVMRGTMRPAGYLRLALCRCFQSSLSRPGPPPTPADSESAERQPASRMGAPSLPGMAATRRQPFQRHAACEYEAARWPERP